MRPLRYVYRMRSGWTRSSYMRRPAHDAGRDDSYWRSIGWPNEFGAFSGIDESSIDLLGVLVSASCMDTRVDTGRRRMGVQKLASYKPDEVTSPGLQLCRLDVIFGMTAGDSGYRRRRPVIARLAHRAAMRAHEKQFSQGMSTPYIDFDGNKSARAFQRFELP